MGRSKLPIVAKPDGSPFYDAAYRFVPGRMDVLSEGDRVAVIGTGTAMQYAIAGAKLAADRGLSVLVLAAASIRPFDVKSVERAARLGAILTVEDHGVQTGLGSLVAETVAGLGLRCRLGRLGVEKYGSSGPSKDVFAEAGITAETVARQLAQLAG
jgi:transketolase